MHVFPESGKPQTCENGENKEHSKPIHAPQALSKACDCKVPGEVRKSTSEEEVREDAVDEWFWRLRKGQATAAQRCPRDAAGLPSLRARLCGHDIEHSFGPREQMPEACRLYLRWTASYVMSFLFRHIFYGPKRGGTDEGGPSNKLGRLELPDEAGSDDECVPEALKAVFEKPELMRLSERLAEIKNNGEIIGELGTLQYMPLGPVGKYIKPKNAENIKLFENVVDKFITGSINDSKIVIEVAPRTPEGDTMLNHDVILYVNLENATMYNVEGKTLDERDQAVIAMSGSLPPVVFNFLMDSNPKDEEDEWS